VLVRFPNSIPDSASSYKRFFFFHSSIFLVGSGQSFETSMPIRIKRPSDTPTSPPADAVPPFPPSAPPVSPIMRLFSKRERDYIENLPKNARQRIRRALEASQDIDEPLRVSVLRTTLPRAYKMNLFKILTCEPSDKNEALVRSAMRIPYGSYSKPPTMEAAEFLKNAEKEMNAHITGHDLAKREVLSMLAQWHGGGHNPFAIALEGPPGIGKSTFVKHALASVIGRPLATIALGGASDASHLIGHGFTYEGARPGRLVEGLMETKRMDPVIYFDELDKVSDTARGDELMNTLIHLTDPVMNSSIRDRYFQGLDLDFSHAILVFSFNDGRKINPILLDRIRRIRLDSPTTSTKMTIAKKHVLPRLREVTCCNLEMTDGAMEAILDAHKDCTGMRSIERSVQEVLALAHLCQQYGSGEIIGFEGAFDGEICAKFARFVLANKTDSGMASGPPPHMYI
jgi:ATP-dependent Lon protease